MPGDFNFLAWVPQAPKRGGTGTALGHVLACASRLQVERLKVAVAFATRGGCTELIAGLGRVCDEWRNVQKQWLVGLDFGTTEPDALRRLLELRSSEVRVHDSVYLLANRLRPRECFHPKMYLLEGSDDSGRHAFGAVVGSANLTVSGLCRRTEQFVTIEGRRRVTARGKSRVSSVDHAVQSWWSQAWDASTPVTAPLVREYERVRPKRVDVNNYSQDDTDGVRDLVREPRHGQSLSDVSRWGSARFFWIYSGTLSRNRGPGRPGNQLDCKRGTRVFFGFPPRAVAPNFILGSIRLKSEGYPWRTTTVRYGNNLMDKVNLPVPGTEGPDSYDQVTLLFERLGPESFLLRIGSARQTKQWLDASRREGLDNRMQGGRPFGFFWRPV